jgi:cytochrome c2
MNTNFQTQFRIRKFGYWLLTLVVMAVVSCTGQTTDTSEVGGDPTRGRQLVSNYGCGACHTIPGVAGADTTVGPSLSDFSQRRIIVGMLVNTPENVMNWIQNPQAVRPNTSMPDMGVTPSDAADIVAYLYTLNEA